MVDWESFYRSFRQPGFLPGYEILHHIGGGAFGEVYKARKSSIGKSYAVKFLKLDDETTKRAIERELEQVRLFAAIDHPNLVTIEDTGVVSEVPYLIMGYAGEDTLAKRIRRRELSQDMALSVFRQTCAGVEALHERRLAHFDLKPSNVFLNGDVARVGDYGLAKLLSEGQQTLSVGRGTPQYMAPEMLKKRADQRADIYSLGLILFECIAFTQAFVDDAHGAAWGGALREDDRPPVFPAGFPRHLKDVVTRCVRLDPADRYASVSELLAALEPGAAAPAGPVPDERLDEWKETARELARGAAGVARGVWSGVRGKRGETPPIQALVPDSDPFGDEVIAVTGLDGASRAPVTPTTPLAAPKPLFPYGPGAAGATLPVPPRVSGGPLETLVTGFLLGGEILGALVTGPFLLGLRGIARAVDRGARRLPRALGRVAGLLAFLAVCTLLGGLAGALVLVLFTFSTL